MAFRLNGKCFCNSDTIVKLSFIRTVLVYTVCPFLDSFANRVCCKTFRVLPVWWGELVSQHVFFITFIINEDGVFLYILLLIVNRFSSIIFAKHLFLVNIKAIDFCIIISQVRYFSWRMLVMHPMFNLVLILNIRKF